MTRQSLIDRSITAIKKLAYGLLVVWVGFLAPLTFFNTFATSHTVQPYRMALFERMPQARHHLSHDLASLQRQRLTRPLTEHQASITNRGFLFSLAQSLLSSVGHLSLLETMVLFPLVLCLGRLNVFGRLAERSTYLSPLDKPPRLFLSIV